MLIGLLVKRRGRQKLRITMRSGEPSLFFKKCHLILSFLTLRSMTQFQIILVTLRECLVLKKFLDSRLSIGKRKYKHFFQSSIENYKTEWITKRVLSQTAYLLNIRRECVEKHQCLSTTRRKLRNVRQI